jgi:ferrochelatase
LTDRDKKDTIGIVLLNLGGPDSLQAVRPFLHNLFSDRDIIRLGPSFLQKFLAHFIACLRSKKTEKMYSQIGGKSPILDITKAQAQALQTSLNKEVEKLRSSEVKTSQLHSFLSSGTVFKVYIGMRYWHPFIADTVQKIFQDGVRQVIVLSLYPHYSKATTGSAIAEFKRAVEHLTVHASQFKVNYIEQWYDFSPYIDALSELICNGMKALNKEGAEVLFSAHGLPESSIREGDPYVDHISVTIREVMNRLAVEPYNLHGLRWHLSYQSRTGPVKWLQPETGETIIKLAKEGVKNLFIVPISFVSDHIETLYEIDILYDELAKKHGINLKRCQSLNTSEKFIHALRELVLKEAQITTIN